MKLGVFIGDLRLDLFQDENIEINMSSQNIKDITKFYSDYTQSFTVPASKKNNIIFAHWYEADIEQFNANVKVDGRLEVDGILFKEGVFLLEKANKKNGQIYSYTIAFSTSISSLKDILKDFTLQNLDFGTLVYNEANVRTKIQGNAFTLLSSGIGFPLISSKRLWSYGDATSNDVSTVGGSIKWDELYPCISLRKILQAIQTTFGISFGTFIDDYFNYVNAVWFKNKSLINGKVPVTGVENFSDDIIFPSTVVASGMTFNVNKKIIAITINTTYTGEITLRLYRDGNPVKAVTFNGNGSSNTIVLGEIDPLDLSTYKFSVQVNVNITFSIIKIGQLFFNRFSIGGVEYVDVEYLSVPEAPVTTSTNLEYRQLAPNIKIIDFIKNYLTLINGVVHFKDGQYILEPLERYYTRGQVYDITKYVNDDSIEYNRVKLPKKLSFDHNENKVITNTNYNDLNTPIQYGNATNIYDYDGGELSFKSGFEVSESYQLQNEFWAGISIDKDGKEITPKLQLIGYTTNTDEPIYLNNTLLTTAMIYTEQYANFDAGAEPWRSNTYSVENGVNGIEPKTLFQTFYLPFIGGLFNQKNRQLSVTGTFPFRIVNNLKLYDTVVFEQKQYIINDIKLNLNTGKFTATLISNFRPQYREVIYIVDESAQVLIHDIINSDTYGIVEFNDYVPQAWISKTNTPNAITFTLDALPVFMPERVFHISYVLFKDGAPTAERCRITIIQRSEVAPLNAISTEDGILITTEDGEYITTE